VRTTAYLAELTIDGRGPARGVSGDATGLKFRAPTVRCASRRESRSRRFQRGERRPARAKAWRGCERRDPGAPRLPRRWRLWRRRAGDFGLSLTGRWIWLRAWRGSGGLLQVAIAAENVPGGTNWNASVERTIVALGAKANRRYGSPSGMVRAEPYPASRRRAPSTTTSTSTEPRSARPLVEARSADFGVWVISTSAGWYGLGAVARRARRICRLLIGMHRPLQEMRRLPTVSVPRRAHRSAGRDPRATPGHGVLPAACATGVPSREDEATPRACSRNSSEKDASGQAPHPHTLHAKLYLIHRRAR
jgi:hypothetical protein